MNKIKAVNPNIIVRGNVDKPYYLIEYYDLSDNEWHIGYELAKAVRNDCGFYWSVNLINWRCPR